MSEVQVENISHQQSSVSKSISDHKNESSKDEAINYQKDIDLNQSETIKEISNPCESCDIKDTEKVQTIRKCIRKGSEVCYTDMENITVLRRIPERDTSKSSTKSNLESEVFEKIYSYNSGESLFKTFTFEQTKDINDPETVKCIQFWKSVMKKNLAPIKCTLIESNNKLKETKQEKTLRSTEDKKSENKKSEEKKDKLDITVDGARIWSEALKEIQKRKLDQLRLYVKERCQFCTDPFTKALKDEWSVKNFEDQKAEIISLNDWKPKEANQKKQFTFKQKKKSSSKPVKTRTNDNSDLDQTQVEYNNNQMKAEALNPNIPNDGVADVVLPKKPPSIMKSPSRGSSISESSRSKIGNQKTSVEACDSTTDLWPQGMVARNSKTSFVEIARKDMLTQDASIETIFPITGEPCCDCLNPEHWQNLSCFNETCPAKSPKIKVLESSDFDHTRVEKNQDICACTKNLDVVYPSEDYKNKMSLGSLVEGFPHVKDDNKDCSCRYHQTIKNKGKDSEDTINFKGHPPIKEITSTCICQENLAWNEVECDGKFCRIRSRSSSILKQKDRKNGPLKTTKSRTSIENPEKRRQSEDKASPNAGLEMPNRDTEKGKPKIQTVDESNGCICSGATPWNIVTCQSCRTKDIRERSKTNVTTVSADPIYIDKHEDCLSKDANLESICKIHDFNDKAISVEHPPHRICPKDLDQSKHEDFVSCTMKKIDQKCLCRSLTDVNYDAKRCLATSQASKTLVSSKRSLEDDTKCICKVSGLPTTQEVSCLGPECPFQQKYPKMTKKEVPKLFVTPDFHNMAANEGNANKSISSTDGSPSITCPRCKRKYVSDHSNDQSSMDRDEDDSEQELCICKGEHADTVKDKEVICNDIQCLKKSVAEGGTVTKDKYVSANLDQTCNQSICPSTNNGTHGRICSNLSQNVDRNYCYICGYYDCASGDKKTPNTKVYEKI